MVEICESMVRSNRDYFIAVRRQEEVHMILLKEPTVTWFLIIYKKVQGKANLRPLYIELVICTLCVILLQASSRRVL